MPGNAMRYIQTKFRGESTKIVMVLDEVLLLPLKQQKGNRNNDSNRYCTSLEFCNVSSFSESDLRSLWTRSSSWCSWDT